MPARAMVALTWHGKSPREAEVEAKSAELRALMAAGGLTPKGAVHCWQYGARGAGGRGSAGFWQLLFEPL